MILPDVYKMETILLAFDCKDEFYYFIKDEFYYRRILLKKRFIISYLLFYIQKYIALY